MSWSKLKTIILIILAATNLCLAAFVAHRAFLGQYAQVQARENAVAFLQEKGITVEEQIIPGDMELQPQTVVRDRTQEAALAQQILGQEAAEVSLGGGIYRYETQRGSIQFHEDGTFQGQFADGAFPLGEESPEGYAVSFARDMGYEPELLSVEAEAGTDGTETRVTLGQTWNGVPLFNQRMTLVFAQGQCTAIIQGRRLNGTPAADAGKTPISVPTALVSFYQGLAAMGDVCSRINQIQPGYTSSVSAGGGASAMLPVWWIDTDTGAYLLDTMTGELSRTENL